MTSPTFKQSDIEILPQMRQQQNLENIAEKQPHERHVATFDAIEVDYEALPDNASLVAHLGAGAFAGIMEHTVMFPVDSLKTRMQISKSVVPTGIIASVSKISATEGIRALWRGVSSVVLGAGPAHAVYFGVFENTKTFLCNRFTESSTTNIVTDENHPLIASISGIAATTASDALMTPFDVLKQRMQIHEATNSLTLFQLGARMYKNEGIGAFYISYPTTLSLNIPFAAMNFGVYEYSSSLLNPDNNYNPLLHCISGGISGGVASAITNPLDCVKTALQTKTLSSDPRLRAAAGFKDAASALWAQGRYKAFLRGLRPRIVFNVPSTAISWTAYEMAKAYLIKGHD